MLTYRRLTNFNRALFVAYKARQTPDHIISFLTRFEDVGQIDLEEEKELTKEAIKGPLEDLNCPISSVEDKLKETRTNKERLLDIIYPVIEKTLSTYENDNFEGIRYNKGKLVLFMEIHKNEMSAALYQKMKEFIHIQLRCINDLENIREELWCIYNNLCVDWEAK